MADQGASAAVDTSSLALKTEVPAPANVAPKGEARSAATGAQSMKYALEDHQHPRLTSATIVTLDGTNTATVTFTRTFAAEPSIDLTPIAPGGTQPVILQVDSWIQDGGGLYTGCVIRGYRMNTLPASLTLLTALVNFSVSSGSASGVRVSVIALQNSTV